MGKDKKIETFLDMLVLKAILLVLVLFLFILIIIYLTTPFYYALPGIKFIPALLAILFLVRYGWRRILPAALLLGLSLLFIWIDKYPDRSDFYGICFPCKPDASCVDGGDGYKSCTISSEQMLFDVPFKTGKSEFKHRKNTRVILQFENNGEHIKKLRKRLDDAGWSREPTVRSVTKEWSEPSIDCRNNIDRCFELRRFFNEKTGKYNISIIDKKIPYTKNSSTEQFYTGEVYTSPINKYKIEIFFSKETKDAESLIRYKEAFGVVISERNDHASYQTDHQINNDLKIAPKKEAEAEATNESSQLAISSESDLKLPLPLMDNHGGKQGVDCVAEVKKLDFLQSSLDSNPEDNHLLIEFANQMNYMHQLGCKGARGN